MCVCAYVCVCVWHLARKYDISRNISRFNLIFVTMIPGDAWKKPIFVCGDLMNIN